MDGYRESFFKEIWLDEGTISNIFVSDNNIYVIGTISVDNPVIEKEIEAIKELMFEKGKDLVNVVYSDSVEYYNIVRKGSEAEALLGNELNPYIELA